MKAYLCSIGERTTEVCKWKLERLGFEVIMLDKKEDWFFKYKTFIETAEEECIRVDADVILNDKILLDIDQIPEGVLMAQFQYFDFYKNEVGQGNPCYYSKEALKIIKDNFQKIDPRRPEATAWRLDEINNKTWTGERICGMHGYFQDDETVERARQNKIDRKQIELYDFELCDKFKEIK